MLTNIPMLLSLDNKDALLCKMDPEPYLMFPEIHDTCLHINKSPHAFISLYFYSYIFITVWCAFIDQVGNRTLQYKGKRSEILIPYKLLGRGHLQASIYTNPWPSLQQETMLGNILINTLPESVLVVGEMKGIIQQWDCFK